MTTPQDLKEKFWKSLKSDMTVMLGLNEGEMGHMRPMTAQVEDESHGPIWFFSSKDTTIVQNLNGETPAHFSFASKNHGLFATVHGILTYDNDPAVIDRLWNAFVAAWYEGKNDPQLALLRFDPAEAEIWLNESSMLAGIKMMMGIDPKKEYKDKVAHVPLN